jgi:hypothetical protein
MKETLKSIGYFAVGIVVTVGVIILALLFIRGGVWLSEKLLPILSVVSIYAFLACLFILVPLAVFHPTRGFAGTGLYIASYLFGLSLWMTSLLLAYTLWGITAVFIGLCIAGVGVVPVALLATMFNGFWAAFFSLILMLIATFGSRFMAIYVLTKHDEEV